MISLAERKEIGMKIRRRPYRSFMEKLFIKIIPAHFSAFGLPTKKIFGIVTFFLGMRCVAQKKRSEKFP